MKKLQFGTNAALKSDTPKYIKGIYRAIMFLSSLWILIIQPNINFTPEVGLAITKWVSIANMSIYFFCQYFGFVETSTQTEPEATSGNK